MRGTNLQYGARPLKRHIQKDVETLLARKIIEEQLKDGSSIIIDVEDQQYVVKNAQFLA